jgi:ubiquinone/menaquinone biosynthesis C-methylase UbiE
MCQIYSKINIILDVANDFPTCTFYGFDIIEPFSLDADSNLTFHIPDNCKLTRSDLFDGYQYEDNMFDFVHQRMMHLIYHGDKVPWMFSEILRVTKENGWVELLEPDITPKRSGPIFSKIFKAGK